MGSAQAGGGDRMVTVSTEDAADWLVRSALPTFLDLFSLDEEPAYFRGLPPYQGHTPSGRLRGWQGAGRRLADVEAQVTRAHYRVIDVKYSPDDYVRSGAEVEVCRAADYARRAMLPSQLGWDAYRVLGLCAHTAWLASILADTGVELIEDAWRSSLTAIGDRALLRAHDVDQPC